MFLSALHLGKKGKAWRALLNWRSSWLSREVGAYFYFLLLGGLSFEFSSSNTLKLAATAAGIVALFSMDMIYVVAERKPKPGVYSASVLVTALLFFSVFSETIWLFVLVAGWKFLLYSLEFLRPASRGSLRIFIPTFRIVSGFILPLAFIGTASGRDVSVLFLVMAELINRAEFYADLDITTPPRQMTRDMLEKLRGVQVGVAER